MGDGLAQALAARPQLRVVAWDRDPWMLRQALARHDWSEELASGRLVLRLGVDALDLPDLPLVQHPVLAQVYGLERHLVGAPAGPRVGLCVGKLFVDDLAAALRRRGPPAGGRADAVEHDEHLLARLDLQVLQQDRQHDVCRGVRRLHFLGAAALFDGGKVPHVADDLLLRSAVVPHGAGDRPRGRRSCRVRELIDRINLLPLDGSC